MYYYGGYQGYGSGCCNQGGYGYGGMGYGAAIVLVLFILLVIVIGSGAWGRGGRFND
jgi:hypothetical protein